MEYQSRNEPVWIQRSQILSHSLGAQAPESLYLWQEHIEQARPNRTNLIFYINTAPPQHSDEQHYPPEPNIIWNTNIYPLKFSSSVPLIPSEALLYAETV